MATYYVRPDGNNNNAGTGPAASQAWATLTKAAQTIVEGDTVIVGPGTYAEAFIPTFTTDTGVTTRLIGDVRCIYFSDMSPGEVIIKTGVSLNLIKLQHGKDWIFQGITLQEMAAGGGTAVTASMTSYGILFRDCVFRNIHGTDTTSLYAIVYSGYASYVFERCMFLDSRGEVSGVSGGAIVFRGCLFRNIKRITIGGANVLLEGCVYVQGVNTNYEIYLPGSNSGAALALKESSIIGYSAGVRTDGGGKILGDRSILWGTSYGFSQTNSYLSLFDVYLAQSTIINSGGAVRGTYYTSQPPDFEQVGAALGILEKTAPIAGTASLRIVVAFVGRYTITRFRGKAGSPVTVRLKVKKDYAGGVLKVRIGGEGGTVLTAADNTTVQILTGTFIPPRDGWYPVEVWGYVNDPAEHYILVDDVEIS